MAPNKKQLSISQLEKLHTEGAGYDILRYIVLPELLRDDTNTVLYFTGRNLARKFQITSIDEIYFIFEKMGWGRLELVKQKKNAYTFQLMADSVALRIKSPFQAEFRMEAGFIAEALQNMKETACECTEKINKRTLLVEFSVMFNED